MSPRGRQATAPLESRADAGPDITRMASLFLSVTQLSLGREIF
jgi:hypothetical protein